MVKTTVVSGSHVPKALKGARGWKIYCSCGWESSTNSSTPNGAREAWNAHMYAKGFRTAAQVKIVSTPIVEEKDAATD